MSRGRKPSKKFTHLGDVLSKVLQTCRKETHQPLIKVEACWQRAFDPTIAQNARPVAMKGALLMVQVPSSAWIHNLQFQKKEMIRTLNAVIGEAIISDIKFKI